MFSWPRGNTAGTTFAIGEGGLAESARIGVTADAAPAIGEHIAVATGADNGYYEGNITSDAGGQYGILREGDEVNLYNGLPTSTSSAARHAAMTGETHTGRPDLDGRFLPERDHQGGSLLPDPVRNAEQRVAACGWCGAVPERLRHHLQQGRRQHDQAGQRRQPSPSATARAPAGSPTPTDSPVPACIWTPPAPSPCMAAASPATAPPKGRRRIHGPQHVPHAGRQCLSATRPMRRRWHVYSGVFTPVRRQCLRQLVR